MAHGVTPDDFNSYGTRRGDHLVAVRATFANNRLKNEMVAGQEGSFTRLQPDDRVMLLFDAAEIYLQRGQELIVVAGKNYGCGSSRDWAAKGVRLLGVRAVVSEGFERIHRTNLVGMGVLPLEFEAGTTRLTLGIDGSETFTLEGFKGAPEPGSLLSLKIVRKDGSARSVTVKCRIDTSEEREIFQAGGLLQRIAGELMGQGARHRGAQSR
jgi:aconitate hydratase